MIFLINPYSASQPQYIRMYLKNAAELLTTEQLRKKMGASKLSQQVESLSGNSKWIRFRKFNHL